MIIAIGEVVWDIFPTHQALGGAPINVAYHLHSLGQEVRIITRIGNDALGIEALKHISDLGLPTAGIQQDQTLPTGRVDITFTETNEPIFDIVAPAAWDNIDRHEALTTASDAPFLLVFGTLAQRHPTSRAAIRALWDKAAIKLYDVNLRPPFTTRELVEESLRAADIVKLNNDELKKIAAWHGIYYGEEKKAAEELRKIFAIQTLVITAGENGAWVLSPEGFFKHPGFPVQVADPVGAGDAFFGGVIDGIMKKLPWPDCLARANWRGAYVASQPGATPPMPKEKD